MAATKNPAQEAQISQAEFAGPSGLTAQAESTYAARATGPTGLPETDFRPRRRGSIPPPPLLHLVQPGDLITAQYFNNLVLAVQNLQARVDDLEQIFDASYRETRAAAAR